MAEDLIKPNSGIATLATESPDPRTILHFKTLAKFNEKLGSGRIDPNKHFCVISDAKMFWVRGVFIADNLKLDGINEVYNDWEITQNNANTITITLKCIEWDSSTRKWINKTHPLTINAATQSIAGLQSAADKLKEDRITRTNHTISNTSTANDRTIKLTAINPTDNSDASTTTTIPSATQLDAGLLNTVDKKAIDNLHASSWSHIDDSNTFTATTTDVSLNYTCRQSDQESSSTSSTHSQPIGAASAARAGIMTTAQYGQIYTTLPNSIAAEASRAKEAEQLLTTNLSNEISRATGAETTLQNNINATNNRVSALETKVGNESVATQITNAINALDATVGTTTVASGKHVAVQVTEADGKLTGVTVTESDIASAATLSGHMSNTSNPHSVTKAQVGLGNVDNTSDANKPVSTAMQTALNNKVDKTTTVNGHALSSNVTVSKSDVGLGNVTNDAQVKRSEMGVASGVATLGTDGKVPSSQLPSYVDDVLEYANRSSFPATGESGKIYTDLATNLIYRWSGSGYVEISQSLALGETSSTAYAGDKGKAVTDALNTHKADTTVHITSAERTAWNAKTSNTGTVTSVGLSAPTGLTVSSSPVTTSGTLALSFTSGYSIPTTAKQTEWDGKQAAISDLATIRSNASNGATAYGWGNHASAGYVPKTGTVWGQTFNSSGNIDGDMSVDGGIGTTGNIYAGGKVGTSSYRLRVNGTSCFDAGVDINSSINTVANITGTGMFRTTGLISVANSVDFDDAYGYVNVARHGDAGNATCFSWIRKGYRAFGLGYNSSNEIIIGEAATNKTTTPWLTIKSGGVTSSAFQVSGGSSTQFLKADGSLDSSTYVKQIKINGGTYSPSAAGLVDLGTITGGTSSSGSLATHTIWGQSFNGTQDVSGELTGVTNITASGTINAAKLSGQSLDITSGDNSLKAESTGIKLQALANKGTVVSAECTISPALTGGLNINGERAATENWVKQQLSGSDILKTTNTSGSEIRTITIDGRSIDFEGENNGRVLTPAVLALGSMGNILLNGASINTGTSDERLKSVIGNVNLDLDTIANAPSVLFKWYSNGQRSIGSIAQYWNDITPELIEVDTYGYLHMDYGKIALISAINIARKTVDHESKIKQLEERVKELEQMLKK